ncbi:MAG: PorP/SprF family type IX secretion system membrane protein [Crocinitomicaceae bacterium]|nr:PorP/SprF family type IX secretion system membrane protein [Crocinitomicaceae bacterium]
MKRMKYIFTSAFCLLLSTTSFSQQEAQYANIINNPYIVNPAAGGLSDIMQFELTTRSQWIGYNGGPRSLLLTGFSPIKVNSKAKSVISPFNEDGKVLFQGPANTTGEIKHILGGKATYDGIGPFAKTSIHGSYAVHLPFTKKVNIGAGLGLGWSNFGINQERVILYQADDAAYSQFLGVSSSQNIIDANVGITFYGEKFFGGISTTQFLKNKAKFEQVVLESNYNRHYFIVGKYTFDISEKFQIEPNLVAKFAENSPASLDAGARFIFDKSVWFGSQYRTSNALVFQIGANLINNLYISYAFEQGIGPIRMSSNGTHEIQLGFYLGKNRNTEKEINDSKEGKK